MNYYLELRMLPDEGANLGFLWSKVFQQIHIALVEHGFDSEETNDKGTVSTIRKSPIGMSIPEYDFGGAHRVPFPLGDKIRLFAQTKEALEKLNVPQWLIRLEDYVQIKTIKPVPENVEHVYFTRKHTRSAKQVAYKTQKMAEFKAAETGEPIEKWLDEFTQSAPRPNQTLPFIHTASLSSSGQLSKNTFPLFIKMQKSVTPKQGSYSCYGLSFVQTDKQATVPWF